MKLLSTTKSSFNVSVQIEIFHSECSKCVEIGQFLIVTLINESARQYFLDIFPHPGLFYERKNLVCSFINIITNFSKVPNNSTARLLIFQIFSYQKVLIWTYTPIKFHRPHLPLYTLIELHFLLFIYFQCFLRPFLLQLLQ